VLDMRATTNDSVGATINSVTPGSPAAKAGIQAGDIITRLNGRSLVTGARNRGENGDESLAALQLIEMVARLEPGDTVTVEYRRGRETRTATVVTSREPLMAWSPLDDGSFTFRIPFEREGADVTMPRLRRIGPDDSRRFVVSFGGPLSAVELAAMNPDLGAYFGTAEGVLVVDAPARNPFGLKGGDVILSVDGRPARGPSGLHRILASYDRGDVVKLEIMRNRSRQTISAKLERNEE
jgi:serine protease Do